MSSDPAPDEEPRFIGPLGYVLRLPCHGGTRVDIIPFVTADEPADVIRLSLNERVYTRLRPEGGDLHAVVFWRRDEPGIGIYPDVTVYANLEEVFAAYPTLRERAVAFERGGVRAIPGSGEEERKGSVHGAVLEPPAGRPTYTLFRFGFGEEMPFVRVTPVTADSGCCLLFERSGYRCWQKGSFLHTKAQLRPLPPGRLELRREGTGFTVAMHPGRDPRARPEAEE
ncbi:hypothetical protein DSECCO2_359800 [anaerobic digester metagenome]|nr:hypothetical protein [Candidatus Methanomethylophilaceae archaeon]